MGNRIEDAQTDEAYWKALLREADRAASQREERPRANRPIINRDTPSTQHAPFTKNNTSEVDLHQFVVGELRHGTVTKITTFGAFVDLGNFEGLIHVSELSWRRIEHPRDVVHIGQNLSVQIISTHPEESRIALSLKRTKPDPWHNVAQRYHVGQSISGQVSSIMDFGAFVRIEDELEGLLHASELGEGVTLHPRNVLSVGDTLNATIISVDETARKLRLSIKQTGKHD